MLEKPVDVIEDKGGPSAFAEAIGTTAGNVRVWKHRNRLPREWWLQINKAFPDLTLERLQALQQGR